MTAVPVVRAMLRSEDLTILNCQFNPETLSLRKTATWQDHPTTAAGTQPRHQFVGTGAEQLTAKLLFDSFDTLGATTVRTVEQSIGVLLGWLTVPPANQTKKTPQPPKVTFQWGTGISFTGGLTSVDVQYVMFAPDGRPVRAYATIMIKAIEGVPSGTNPTSGGVTGRTSAQLCDGDTLASVAYRQYGDPNLWRAIAVANGIDDPGRVASGTRLLVPPRSEATALAAVRDG
jgi:Contractile injection system tube protein/LysM domain